jgi:hypothetical protein
VRRGAVHWAIWSFELRAVRNDWHFCETEAGIRDLCSAPGCDDALLRSLLGQFNGNCSQELQAANQVCCWSRWFRSTTTRRRRAWIAEQCRRGRTRPTRRGSLLGQFNGNCSQELQAANQVVLGSYDALYVLSPMLLVALVPVDDDEEEAGMDR